MNLHSIGTHWKTRVKRATVSGLAVALCVSASIAATTSLASAKSHPAKHYRSAESTVQAYFQVLNAGMTSGDFSSLSTVYASDATLTKSGPDGKTTVYHGLAEITGFYQGLYAKNTGWQWTTDELRPLSKQIVLAYEHAGSPPLSVASRCIHVFVVSKGMISGYDWAAFFPGQK